MDDKKKFSILLNYLVKTKSNGRTKKDLAKEMDIDVKTLRHWLNGTYSPQRNKYKSIAKTFDITTQIFFTDLDYYIDDNGEIIYKKDLDIVLNMPFVFNEYIDDQYNEYSLFDEIENIFYKIAEKKGYHINKNIVQNQLRIRYYLNIFIDELLPMIFSEYKTTLKKDNDKDYLLFEAKKELEQQKDKLESLLTSNDFRKSIESYGDSIENVISGTRNSILHLEEYIKTLE